MIKRDLYYERIPTKSFNSCSRIIQEFQLINQEVLLNPSRVSVECFKDFGEINQEFQLKITQELQLSPS